MHEAWAYGGEKEKEEGKSKEKPPKSNLATCMSLSHNKSKCLWSIFIIVFKHSNNNNNTCCTNHSLSFLVLFRFVLSLNERRRRKRENFWWKIIIKTCSRNNTVILLSPCYCLMLLLLHHHRHHHRFSSAMVLIIFRYCSLYSFICFIFSVSFYCCVRWIFIVLEWLLFYDDNVNITLNYIDYSL